MYVARYDSPSCLDLFLFFVFIFFRFATGNCVSDVWSPPVRRRHTRTVDLKKVNYTTVF